MSTPEGSSPTERSLDRPVMTFDLPAILGTMKREGTWRSARRNAMTIVKQPVFRVVLVALQSGAEVGEHQTDGPVTVQVLEGRVVVEVDEEQLVLGAGQLLVLRPELPHSIRAKDDAAFLLTLAAETTHPAEHPA